MELVFSQHCDYRFLSLLHSFRQDKLYARGLSEVLHSYAMQLMTSHALTK